MAVLAKEKILTLDYWKPVSQLQAGDYIFDKDGKIVQVKLVQPYMADKCYEVILDDHLSFSGDRHMELLVETNRYRTRLATYKGKRKFTRPLTVKNVEDLFAEPLMSVRKSGKRDSKYSIVTCKPLELPYQDLPVAPFVFGFWYRSSGNHGRHTVPKAHFDFIKEKLHDSGFITSKAYETKYDTIRFNILPLIEPIFKPDIITQIPNNYLMASKEQRIELLSGLVMAKFTQYNEKTNWFKITLQSWPTIHKIQGLVESLGCKTITKFDAYTKYYCLAFKTWHKIHPHQKPFVRKIQQDRRYIREVREIPPQMCVHIETDGEDGSFLIGEGFLICR